MAVVQIACNRNADLIEALKSEGLIEEIDTILADSQTETIIHLYEGRDNWYFEIWRSEQQYECIVPKSVPKDVAIDMVLYKELKEDVEDYMNECKYDFEWCVEDCYKFYEDEEERSECIEECSNEYEECVSRVKSYEIYRAYEDAKEGLSKHRIVLIDCFPGRKVEHPDIDEVCVFRT